MYAMMSGFRVTNLNVERPLRVDRRKGKPIALTTRATSCWEHRNYSCEREGLIASKFLHGTKNHCSIELGYLITSHHPSLVSSSHWGPTEIADQG